MSNFSFEESRLASSKAAVKTMKDDVKEIETRLESKLDMLTAQFENLTLTLSKMTMEWRKLVVLCSNL